MADLDLEGLVSQLPELYQPIYGDEPGASSRAADLPRTASIVESAKLLERHVCRPLRVLDLGSAQGYLAFVLAEHGHHVTGIDYLPINVQVARAIHDRHPDLDVAFIDGDVTDATVLACLDDFDLVLGMSILHHVVHSKGLGRAVDLVDHLSQHVEHGLFEMALRTEPMCWAESQPRDPRVVLTSYPFIRQIASSPTHLSSIHRPLLFCSSSVAMLNGELHPIRAFSESSHAAAPDVVRGKRRYFTLDAGLMKIAARFDNEADDEHLKFVRDELRHEARVLGSLAECGLTVPAVIEFVDNADETILAKTSYPGELLSVVNHALDDAARTRITDAVVAELARYEEHGWYHTDLRLWNVVWNEVGGTAHLIDHGSLQREPGDVVWPGDAPYSFAAFLCALWSVADDRTGLTAPRALPIGAKSIPARVLTMLDWTLRQRRDRQFFRDAEAVWTATPSDVPDVAGWPTLGWEWLLSFGERLDRVRSAMDEEVQRALSAYEKLHGEYESALQGYDDLHSEYEHLGVEFKTTAERERRLQTAHDQHVAGYERLHGEYEGAIAGYETLHARYDSALASYSRLEGLYNSSTAALEELRTGHEALLQVQSDDHRALENAAHRLAQIESSFSWRVTRPLRFIRRLLG